jgi:hypothetical protein
MNIREELQVFREKYLIDCDDIVRDLLEKYFKKLILILKMVNVSRDFNTYTDAEIYDIVKTARQGKKALSIYIKIFMINAVLYIRTIDKKDTSDLNLYKRRLEGTNNNII